MKSTTKGDVEMLATTTKAEIEKLELRLIIKIAAIVISLVGLVRGLFHHRSLLA